MYLTVKECAKTLRLCPQSIRNLIKAGKIVAIRPGNGRSTYRIHPAELDKFLIEELKRTKKENDDGLG